MGVLCETLMASANTSDGNVDRAERGRSCRFPQEIEKGMCSTGFHLHRRGIDEVEELLKQHVELYDPNDPSHILVRNKKM